MAVGINANSPNQDLAWEFIKFLSSDGLIELGHSSRGIPVNIRAFESIAMQQFLMYGQNELDSLQLASLDAYIDTVKHFMNLFNHVVFVSGIIDDMTMIDDSSIWLTMFQVHNGAMGIEEAANFIQYASTIVLQR